MAVDLLGEIGSAQRWNAAIAEPSHKPGIQLALPAIQAALKDPATCTQAAQAAWSIGPPAASITPDLIELTADRNESAALAALQAFELIGLGASNAVPLLIQIATNETSAGQLRQLYAVQSLGGIGDPARLAAPVLASLLQTRNSEVNVAAARSLAELGVTPESALPALEAMRRGTNEWTARVASLALWNRRRDDYDLQAEIIAALRSVQRGWMTFCLENLGTNASPFAGELHRLLSDRDEIIRGQARMALRKIESPSP